MTSPMINSPTNPHDRMGTALDTAYNISIILISSAHKAWRDRIYSIVGAVETDFTLEIVDFNYAIGSQDDGFYTKKIELICQDILRLANRPVNKFALMPDRTRPEEPWANELNVDILENITLLQKDMIGAISDLSGRMKY